MWAKAIRNLFKRFCQVKNIAANCIPLKQMVCTTFVLYLQGVKFKNTLELPLPPRPRYNRLAVRAKKVLTSANFGPYLGTIENWFVLLNSICHKSPFYQCISLQLPVPNKRQSRWLFLTIGIRFLWFSSIVKFWNVSPSWRHKMKTKFCFAKRLCCRYLNIIIIIFFFLNVSFSTKFDVAA